MDDIEHSAAQWRAPPAGSHARRPTAHPDRSATTRILHLALLLIVLHQLIGSEFMHRPYPGESPGIVWILHEWVGMAGFGVLIAFWVWSLVRRGETALRRLFPWFSVTGMAAVLADLIAQLRRALRGQLPEDDAGALVTAIHGAGLLVVTAMAATGTLYFFLDGDQAARLALDVHKTLANLVWAYLVLHAGMAALHHLLGTDILSRMFWPPRRRTEVLRRRR